MAKFRLSLLTTFTFILITTFAQSQNSRKLDETTPPDLNKCGNCPCNQPCNPPPSLPPPTPSPPPPSPPPPPPPKKTPPPGINCPPPPEGGNSGGGGGQYPPNEGGSQYPPNPPYIYVNGPPGNVYPVAPYMSGSGRIGSMGFVLFLIFLGVIGFLVKED